ncbi:MAG: hypothetical protein KBT03_07205 [Bacteroidales bacterium]|nr:hypothetical protein [Candidatus Scybalousia scybalohippi]
MIDFTFLYAIKNTPTLLWSVRAKSDVNSVGKRRRSYGLTKEKAQRLSSTTRNSYLDQYCDYKVKELNDDR